MQVAENFSLKQYNTFGVDVMARKFISVHSTVELRDVLQQAYASEIFVLGGGSNMLLTKDIDKTVIHIGLKGIELISESRDDVVLKVGAGENWHQFVLYCIEKGFGGLENLSLIPGNVGTAPVQNIGAYGVELKDSFESCEAMRIQTLEVDTFSAEQCEFDYRNSVFKNKLKGEYIITSVNFRLCKKDHQLSTSYGAIQEELDKHNIEKPTIKNVSDAVISIRQQKLPDPRELGNSGSFFKNPVIKETEFKKLQKQFPEMPFYALHANQIKIPAGWLIDQAGLKGYRQGDAGVHKNQALVLVNYGNATGQEILALSKEIQDKIYKKYGIQLEPEVNVI
ncbi:UDP-N-acetylmuramate dehydrogenase [Salegentibacter salarius]|uniref:UDP-N-acetylenolpyruvoylglucosamine reductase n=1 Tax=Salegentibacter salarius TaxID=435906 RepID=A0A2N0TXC3_9FLAO|nr:UDP-N-acetylmuramate dehydrogenase [Salegentibacter salarius]OEY73107.1 UDP-N-acetylenolpyruvoylglucosamine reductase [Salegentibacter salarius]PKD19390.1 UDP-N-acetylenolpyruvoylglucosamine reductase [Salegentibacter salarius]SLJ99500.1 UDP-N-acetylmuramate dehydrogenase [Salegentibacter salarius]